MGAQPLQRVDRRGAEGQGMAGKFLQVHEAGSGALKPSIVGRRLRNVLAKFSGFP
jgi:hypothetical protein